jgi:hypothetical protein
MTPTIAGDFSIQQAVAELLRWSDAQDAALKARLAAEAAAHRAGFAQGFEAGRRAALESLAEENRQIAAELAGLPTRPRFAELELRRWNVRGEPRARLAFGDPAPGDFPGRGPAALRRAS